jgi:hypothetical protein
MPLMIGVFMNVEVEDYREFSDRKYFVEFSDGNRSVWDAEKCLVKIFYDEDEVVEAVLTHEHASMLGKSVKEWEGHEITGVRISNSLHLDGEFVEGF